MPAMLIRCRGQQLGVLLYPIAQERKCIALPQVSDSSDQHLSDRIYAADPAEAKTMQSSTIYRADATPVCVIMAWTAQLVAKTTEDTLALVGVQIAGNEWF